MGVADDAPSKDARGSSGDSEDREASCAGEGRCSSDEAADGRRGEAAGAGATSALDDDDLPALDLYADDEGPGKKKKRRKKKRKYAPGSRGLSKHHSLTNFAENTLLRSTSMLVAPRSP